MEVGEENTWFTECLHINDNYELYRNLVAYGFQKGSPEAEDILSRGGCCLIIYSVGNL